MGQLDRSIRKQLSQTSFQQSQVQHHTHFKGHQFSVTSADRQICCPQPPAQHTQLPSTNQQDIRYPGFRHRNGWYRGIAVFLPCQRLFQHHRATLTKNHLKRRIRFRQLLHQTGGSVQTQ